MQQPPPEAQNRVRATDSPSAPLEVARREVERTFAAHELFFSTTDTRGIIRAGNDVFARISGYSREELIGKPHNLVRHPHMPRGVFALMWRQLQARQPFCGYVKNRAKDGGYYWVFAVVVPLPEGFVSVRFKPSTPHLSQVESVYAELVAVEAAALSAGARAPEVAAAGERALSAKVHALGHDSYDAFSHALLNTEITARDALLQREGRRLFPDQLSGSVIQQRPALAALYEQSVRLYGHVNELFAQLDGFSAHARGMQGNAATVLALAEEFHLGALNAHIAAEPLAAQGVTLGTIARFLNGYSATLGTDVTRLGQGIDSTTTAVAGIASNLSMARLLLEMTLFFKHELLVQAAAETESAQARPLLRELADAFAGAMGLAAQALGRLQTELPGLSATAELLRQTIITLQVAQMSGLIEAARLDQADGLRTMFHNFRQQIEQAHAQLEQLGDLVALLAQVTRATPPKIQAVQLANEQLHQQLAATAG